MRKPVIESNVPRPAADRGRCHKYKWLAEIEVGQSFTAPKSAVQKLDQAYRKMLQGGHLPAGYKLSRRTLDGGTMRVWRIA
ncbi:MAG: hypothetical protein Unbinned8622contig1005_9 [Prokaryotic dsDNA virus sp.]|nr:MAG: hypothetical protein Unbinned8622contig1005_9 [Prokaryotic dsDNA virus sp.]